MPNYKVTVEQIDAVLPQTQCGECGYAGCLPYAKAIVNQDEVINKCPPGGVNTLKQLGEVLEQDITPYIEEIKHKTRPPQTAIIREAECIGCTKCIKACPVDAIIGASKQMHSVIKQECTGCELCVPACPVDCIDIIEIEKPLYSPEQARNRYQAKQKQLLIQEKQKREKYQQQTFADSDVKHASKKAFIHAALERVKQKKGQD